MHSLDRVHQVIQVTRKRTFYGSFHIVANRSLAFRRDIILGGEVNGANSHDPPWEIYLFVARLELSIVWDA